MDDCCSRKAETLTLLAQGEQRQAAHRSIQPYGQVPTYREGDLTLFESGAIVHHVATTRAGLLPNDPAARARAIEWMFAALNTVEVPVTDLAYCDLFEETKPWSVERRPSVERRIRRRLAETAARLGDAEWLDGDFSVGDLLMIDVLRALNDDALLAEQPALVAYVARGTARTAFGRALAAQLAGFTGTPPGWND